VVLCVANVVFQHHVCLALKTRHVFQLYFSDYPLCAERSLRDLYTPSVGAPVGRDEIFREPREACTHRE
jgi:hypothetical protein